MDISTPRTMTISRDIRVSQKMLELRKTFGRKIEEKLNISNVKIGFFFERAFIRWIFNTIMKGLNPFVDLITALDFVSVSDIDYFAKKHGYEQQFSTFSWTWLTKKFKQIHSTPSTPCGVTSKTFDENKVFLTYTWLGSEYVQCNIPISVYQRICAIYTGDVSKMDDFIILLISRYDACGSTNNHCSIPPKLVKFCDVTTEMFGSPLNTCARQYCSPFPDIESHFGSMGSFFDHRIEFSTGVYLMNPPYDEDIMIAAAHRVISILRNVPEITIIIVFPVWDPKSQKNIQGKSNFNKKFEALDLIVSSNFVLSKTILDFTTHPFFDYYKDSYVKVTDTHLIILSNTNYELNAIDIAQQWGKICQN
jgi:hypothetical protein